MYLFKFFFKGHDTSLDLVSGAGDGWVERIVEAHLDRNKFIYYYQYFYGFKFIITTSSLIFHSEGAHKTLCRRRQLALHPTMTQSQC